MARPKHRSETRPITISLPAETHDYLVLLATRGKLGPAEQDIAAHIVIREVDLMMAVDYHDKKLPKCSFTAVFFIQCMQAIGVRAIHLDDGAAD